MNQPPPKKTDSQEVWPAVAALIESAGVGNEFPRYWRQKLSAKGLERHEFGKAKYGVALQVENGRDPLEDCLDEALDGAAYAYRQQALTKDPADLALLRDFVSLAGRILQRMEARCPDEVGRW